MNNLAARRTGLPHLSITSGLAFWAFVVVAVANVGANLAAAWWPGAVSERAAGTSQWLLMPLLALALWTAAPAPRGRLVRWTVLALAFSWVGDALPDVVGGDAAFLAMVGGFLAAQVAYIVAFWPLRRQSLAVRPVSLGAYALVAIAVVGVCVPRAGGLAVPVVIYGACLATMAILATGLGPVGGVGGALFLVSDALIALRQFDVIDPPASGFWVMATYILAQGLLAGAVARRASGAGGGTGRTTGGAGAGAGSVSLG